MLLPICLSSVHHMGGSVKKILKLGLLNFLSPYSSPIPPVLRGKFHPKTIRGIQGRGGGNIALNINILKTVQLITSTKSHMRCQLASIAMTLVTLNSYKFEFLENFAVFHRFGGQQQLNN